MKISYFSFGYIFYLLIDIGLFLGLFFLMRNKSEKYKKYVVFVLLVVNFLQHILKNYIYPSYANESFFASSLYNICSVIVIFWPFLFLVKNETLHDATFLIGTIAGLLPVLLPYNYIGENMFGDNTIRYYLCHILIFNSSALPVALGLHKLSYKRVWRVPLILLLMQVIILVNDFVFWSAGFLPECGNTIQEFVSPTNITNTTFIFGLKPGYNFVGGFFTWLTPSFFLHNFAGEVFYWPILWMAIPVYLYGLIIAFLYVLPFDFKNIKKDISLFVKQQKNKNEKLSKISEEDEIEDDIKPDNS